MPQGELGGRDDASDVSGAEVVAQAVAATEPVRLDVRAGGRLLQAWVSDGEVGARDGNPADTLALVLTLPAGAFEWSIEPDDEFGRLPAPHTRPASVAVAEAGALIAEARDHGWLVPTNDHVVRWAARLGGAADIDKHRWHALTGIGSGCSLTRLTMKLGGELAARRAVRDLFAVGLVVIEEPLALRTAVRVPMRILALPMALPTIAAPNAIAEAPVDPPSGQVDDPDDDIVADTATPAAPDATVSATRPAAPAGAPVAGESPDGMTSDTGSFHPPSTSGSIVPPAVTPAGPVAPAIDPFTVDTANEGWGQAPQVEEEAGWDDPAPVTDTAAAWDDARAQDVPAGWDDAAVHVEDVVGWDDLAASATTPRPVEPPRPPAAQRPATPAAAPSTTPTAASATVGPASSSAEASCPVPTVAPTPPVAPKAPTAVPTMPAPGGTADDDDALSRAQLYQFLSSMRS